MVSNLPILNFAGVKWWKLRVKFNQTTKRWRQKSFWGRKKLQDCNVLWKDVAEIILDVVLHAKDGEIKHKVSFDEQNVLQFGRQIEFKKQNMFE